MGEKLNNTLLGMLPAAAGSLLGIAMQGANDKRQLRQQEKLQRLQIEGNKEMLEAQRLKELQMWHDTSYPAQMKMIKEAGLNPALLYGMGGGGGTTVGGGSGGVSGGQAPIGGGEIGSMMGIGLQTKAQIELLKAQKENIEADTANKTQDTGLKGAQTANVTVDSSNKWIENQIKELQLKLEGKTWKDKATIVNQEMEQAVRQTSIKDRENEMGQELYEETMDNIRAQYAGTLLQNAETESRTALNKQQADGIVQGIMQKWKELNQTGSKNEWEHHDRLKAIEEYTANALKVAGIVAAGNIVRDVTGIATRKLPKGKTTEHYGPKGRTETYETYNY